MKKIKFTQLKTYIFAVLIILIAELTLGNLSTYRSLPYKEQSLLPQMTVEGSMDSGEFTLDFGELNTTVNNLHLDIVTPDNVPLTYTIWLTDEGNAYEYALPETQLLSNVKSTLYHNVYPYGKVHSMRICCSTAAGSSLSISDICINCKRPLMVNVLRMLLIYLVFLFLYALRKNSSVMNIAFDAHAKNQLLFTFLTIILLIMLGLFLSSSNKLFREQDKPHHQQYKELAMVLKKGQVYLDGEPSEGLLNAPNPYDTIYLQANQIDYRMDYAYYNGKYYVYFGIVPELLLYFPCYMLTGKLLPNHVAVFLFFSLFVLSVFMLYRQLIIRYRLRIPFYVYILGSASTIFTGTYAFLIERADLYNVPVMGGIAFTALGLWLWCLGLFVQESQSAKYTLFSCILFFLGSLSMALVVGCRPQMFLFSFLALPLFWNAVWKERRFFSGKSIPATLCMIVPYLIVAAVLMDYNYLRFGSVFDFGATYSLTNNDMNLRGTNLHRMFYGLICFLCKPVTTKGTFPFITDAMLDTSYMGRMVTEYFYGGIISCHLLTFSLFLLGPMRQKIKAKRMTWVFAISLCASLIIGLVDANQAGILQRYSADMAFGIYFGTALMLFLLAESAESLRNKTIEGTISTQFGAYTLHDAFILFLKIGFLTQILYFFLVALATEGGISMQLYNPELFYRIASVLRF